MNIRYHVYNKTTRKLATFCVTYNKETKKYDVVDFRSLKTVLSYPNFHFAKEYCDTVNAVAA